MKLSEAIRIGAAKYPQIRSEWVLFDDDCQVQGCCALGAAMLAVAPVEEVCSVMRQEGEEVIMYADWLSERLEVNLNTVPMVAHPRIGGESSIATTITHLNDFYYKSFAEIIEWLEAQGL